MEQVSRLVGRVRVVAVWVAVSLLAPVAGAQSQHVLAGLVVDQADAVLPGARVSIADSSGRVVHTTTTNGEGLFSVVRLSPGPYTVTVELPQFIAAVQQVRTDHGSVACSAIVLAAGGFSDDVVVTGRRAETRITDTPQKMEVIDATDIERTVAADLTDVMKKNAGVDVIQYGGAFRHWNSRIPAAVLGHQQTLTAAHRRPAVRRDQPRDAAPGRHRSHRSAQGGGLVDLRLLGDGWGL